MLKLDSNVNYIQYSFEVIKGKPSAAFGTPNTYCAGATDFVISLVLCATVQYK
jgi:hypothetical protein